MQMIHPCLPSIWRSSVP